MIILEVEYGFHVSPNGDLLSFVAIYKRRCPVELQSFCPCSPP